MRKTFRSSVRMIWGGLSRRRGNRLKGEAGPGGEGKMKSKGNHFGGKRVNKEEGRKFCF